MKRIIVAGMLALVAFTGCVGKRDSSSVHTNGTTLSDHDAATIAEIRAAARLSFDNHKFESLNQIAQRRDLSPSAQVQLVNSTYCCLNFENHKVDVLRTIIGHPAFSDAARHAIVLQLDKLAFDNHRKEILQLINRRVSRS